MKRKILFCLAVGFITACQVVPSPQENPRRYQSHPQARKSPLATRLRILKEEIENMPVAALQNIGEEIKLLEALLQTTQEVSNQLRPSSELAEIVDSLKKRIEVIEQKLGIESPVEQPEPAGESGTPSIELTAPEVVSPVSPSAEDSTASGTGESDSVSAEPVVLMPVPDSSEETVDSDKPMVSLPEASADSDTTAPADSGVTEAAPSSTETDTATGSG